jgi:hypothetical protein
MLPTLLRNLIYQESVTCCLGYVRDFMLLSTFMNFGLRSFFVLGASAPDVVLEHCSCVLISYDTCAIVRCMSASQQVVENACLLELLLYSKRSQIKFRL